MDERSRISYHLTFWSGGRGSVRAKKVVSRVTNHPRPPLSKLIEQLRPLLHYNPLLIPIDLNTIELILARRFYPNNSDKNNETRISG